MGINKNMEYLGEFWDYQLYRNSEGFIEGYKSIGLVVKRNSDGAEIRTAKKLIRVVTNTKKIGAFPNYITKREQKKINYDPYKDENQIKLAV